MGITKSKAVRNLIMFGCLAFSLGFFPARLSFAEKQGANIIVTLKDRPPASGELLAVREDSLILMDSISKVGLTIDFNDIKSVQIIRKSQVLLGMLGGFAVGLAISSATKHQYPYTGDDLISSELNAVVHFAAAATAITLGATAVGVLIGGAIGTDKTIIVRGYSPLEVKNILWKLRSKAKMPEAR